MDKLEHMATVIDIALNSRKNIVHIDEIDPPDEVYDAETERKESNVRDMLSMPLGFNDVAELLIDDVPYTDLKALTKALNSKDHAAIGKAMLDSVDACRESNARDDEGLPELTDVGDRES